MTRRLDSKNLPRAIVPLGQRTPWGRISAVGIIEGERYYWLLANNGRSVAMMPACVIEDPITLKPAKPAKLELAPEAKNKAKRAGGKASARNRKGLKRWVVRAAPGE